MVEGGEKSVGRGGFGMSAEGCGGLAGVRLWVVEVRGGCGRRVPEDFEGWRRFGEEWMGCGGCSPSAERCEGMGGLWQSWENCGGGGRSVRVSEAFEGVLRGGEEWERRRSWGKCRRVWRTGRSVEVVVRRSRGE